MSLNHLAAEYRKNMYTKPQYGLKKKVYGHPGCIINTPAGRIAGIASLRRQIEQMGEELGRARVLQCKNGRYAVAFQNKEDGEEDKEYRHREFVYFAESQEQALEQAQCLNEGRSKDKLLYQCGYLHYLVDRGQPVGMVEVRWV